jgi:hypothetical protein
MLVACRLAGLSALGAHYAGVSARTQSGACHGNVILRLAGDRHDRVGDASRRRAHPVDVREPTLTFVCEIVCERCGRTGAMTSSGSSPRMAPTPGCRCFSNYSRVLIRAGPRASGWAR